jgi:succinate dehydrogenase / fumarate reductase cytochrome b subunit
MSWFTSTFSGSIGKKIIMALTGLFLCSFLVIHLIGNLQLLTHDSGMSFNHYAKFMTGNPLIKTVSYLLYTSIIVHSLYALLLTMQNRKARPVGYAYSNPQANSEWNSRNMGILGTITLIFIVIHMKDFWWQYHNGDLPLFTLEDGSIVKDLFKIVIAAFSEIWYVVLYVVCMVALAYHLHHGFKSSFQTFGLNHKKYTPFIRQFGLWFSILIPAAFAAIPLFIYYEQVLK